MSAPATPGPELAVEVAGEGVVLRADRTLYWPAAELLLAADLHWGKGGTFRAAGLPLPPGALAADLARLAGALAETAARRLLVLGDLVHARQGVTDDLVARVAEWRRDRTAGVEIELVPGNHDRWVPELPAEWAIRRREPEVAEGPFRFAHDPAAPRSAAGGGYLWAGHLHPVARLSGGGDALRLPCFHLGARVGVLPAFSTFAGGVATGSAPGDRKFAVAGERVVEVGFAGSPVW